MYSRGFSAIRNRTYSKVKRKYTIIVNQIPHNEFTVGSSGKSSLLITYYNTKKYTLEVDHTEIYQLEYNRKSGGNYPCRTQIFNLRNNETRKGFILINLHGIGIPFKPIRHLFFEYLIDFINKFNDIYPIIMVGDFNCELLEDNIYSAPDDSAIIDRNINNLLRYSNKFSIYPNIKSTTVNPKTSYHRWVWDSYNNVYTDKHVDERYKTLDYLITKNKRIREVQIDRTPINLTEIEVPYKEKVPAAATFEMVNNFDHPVGFPSDHTMNIYTIKFYTLSASATNFVSEIPANPKPSTQSPPQYPPQQPQQPYYLHSSYLPPPPIMPLIGKLGQQVLHLGMPVFIDNENRHIIAYFNPHNQSMHNEQGYLLFQVLHSDEFSQVNSIISYP